MAKLSILIPLYNEADYIFAVLERVWRVGLPSGLDREIIVVDDGSTDDSADRVHEFQALYPDAVRLIQHVRNRGKGAAIHTAIQAASGDFTVIQDADLEYDPQDFSRLLGPLLSGHADSVYGSRFVTSAERRVLYYWHSVGNHLLTWACNVVADLNLTDMETCYKAFRTGLLTSIPLTSERFGFEPEITIKLAKRKAAIYEVPISYHGRTYSEGKKIRAKDGIAAVFTIARHALSHNVYKDHGQQILPAFSMTENFNSWMADTIRPYLGSEVMEIGAGIGNLSRQLARGRKRYVATDLDKEQLVRLKASLPYPHLEVGACDLENPADFRPYGAQLDTVFCLNVLEHVNDDIQGLRNMYSVLRPGGRAIVLVPEGATLYGTLDEVLGHYRRYSGTELQTKMEEVGFQVERVIGFNRVSRPAWFVAGKVLKRDEVSIVQLRLFDRLVWLWQKCDRWLPWSPTSIIGVAVRGR